MHFARMRSEPTKALMSKGQRGNKEVKKPKKVPAPAAPELPATASVKGAAAVAVAPRSK